MHFNRIHDLTKGKTRQPGELVVSAAHTTQRDDDYSDTCVVVWFATADGPEAITNEAATLMAREFGKRPVANQISYTAHRID